jgi:hypothetical protein
VEPETRALCAVHPERAADAGICSRCGTFLCAECRAPGTEPAVCVECEKRASKAGLVRQVPALGITMMVHGGLVLLLGIFLLVYGVSLAVSFGSMPEPAPIDPSAPGPQMMEGIMTWTMLGLGVVHALVGVLQLVAGFYVRASRGRVLGIVALLLGILTVFGCYCGPTALALIVWGLIVLLSGPVGDRFAQIRRSSYE